MAVSLRTGVRRAHGPPCLPPVGMHFTGEVGDRGLNPVGEAMGVLAFVGCEWRTEEDRDGGASQLATASASVPEPPGARVPLVGDLGRTWRVPWR